MIAHYPLIIILPQNNDFFTIFWILFSTHNTAGLIQKNPWISPGANLFQSTKPQGLRHCWKSDLSGRTYFNPRSRKGFDLYGIQSYIPFPISIHEAARASTSAIADQMMMTQFQSTKPQGLRLILLFSCLCLIIFQSTKPQGLRLI